MSQLSSPLVSLASQPSASQRSNIPATPQSRLPSGGRAPPPQTPSSASSSGSRLVHRSPPQRGEARRPVRGREAEREEVWGTTIDVNAVESALDTFFDRFVPNGGTEGEGEAAKEQQGEPLYPRLIQEAIALSSYCLDVDVTHLQQFSAELAQQMLTYPVHLLPVMDRAIEKRRQRFVRIQQNEDSELDVQDDPSKLYLARPYHLPSSHVRSMRSLDPEDIDTLVAIKGLVIRCSSLIPDMQEAHFQCSVCQHEVDSQIEDGEIAEPVQCRNPSCRTKHSYRLIHNRCRFIDKQIIKLQETPDTIPEGETPHSVSVHVFKELVDQCQPGDRVEITGIFRADAARVNPRQSTLQTVYRTHLDGLHVRIHDHRQRLGENAHTLAEQDEEVENEIRQLAADPRIYERLVASLAPSIWEMDDVKKGLLCLLFGGANADQGAGHGRSRGEINILMCGDPGTSKSQLLQYVNKLAPRGIYTSGKGSSAVGLTAFVSKDPETREMVLESGALVLSDRGVCCIDEFDKMSDSTRSILHEVMEQQTVSIAKAGIVCTLNARTSILASANPKESRYNPKLSVVENIQIMPTLLSRFDLIYLILDQPNLSKDRKLARHLVQLYFKEGDVPAAAPERPAPLAIIPQEKLTAYIAYARKHVRPQLSEQAQDLLIEGYMAMRKVGQVGNNKVVTATPRQLEALVRLSEALARMQLRNVVDASHVTEARRLMAVATASAATDPTTGCLDLDLLFTGHSANERRRDGQIRDAMLSAIEALLQRGGASLRIARVLEHANDNSDEVISDEQARRAISDLVAEGLIAFVGRGQDAVRKL